MNHRKKTLDYVAFILISLSAVYLVFIVLTSSITFSWEHYVGLVFLVVTGVGFKLNHNIGVLLLGLMILLGLIGFLSFSPAISSYFLEVGPGDSKFTILKFQPIFLIWLIMHLVFSNRYYFGIATREYWKHIGEKI